MSKMVTELYQILCMNNGQFIALVFMDPALISVSCVDNFHNNLATAVAFKLS